MQRKIMASLLTLIVLFALALPVQADEQIDNSLAWLKTQQQADGGFTNGFSEGSDLGTTCDVLLAIAAAGEDASTWVSDDGLSPLDYLSQQVSSGAVEILSLKAKIVMALVSTGQDPASFAGADLIADLNAGFDESTGSYGGNTFEQALVMLALRNAGQPVPAEAAQLLLDSQAEDGAWALFGETKAGAGDTNTTAMVMQALVAAGEEQGLEEALAYLQAVQNGDGGFPYQSPSEYGTDTDANSTAVVLQALLAAGEALDDWAPVDAGPLEALDSLYDATTGAFLWQAVVPSPNVLATAQAIPALVGVTFVELPSVAAAAAPEAAPATESAVPEEPTATLPSAGGSASWLIALASLGALALGAGLALRRYAARQ
mgnify:FL=1